jgi:NAD(P)-dependent dehydrogenase (short-subunit alcohol dehydrogenase family)
MIDFDGRVAIVTGAGRGLGRLYALELAHRGARVVVNDLGTSLHGDGSEDDVAANVVEEINRAGGIAVASSHDVADPVDAEAIVRTALERFGRVDAVVSNAGILKPTRFEEVTLQDWRRTLGVHLDGSFSVAQAAFRVMKAQGYGRFVFISSSAGVFGQHETAHYAAAKTGLLGLANVIALEGTDHGIAANTVLPFAQTRMSDATAQGADEASEVDALMAALRPELVVPLVVFLASAQCTTSKRIYSAGGGRFARVFVGLGEGWLAEPDVIPSPEDIAAHVVELERIEPHSVPATVYDEVGDILVRRNAAGYTL